MKGFKLGFWILHLRSRFSSTNHNDVYGCDLWIPFLYKAQVFLFAFYFQVMNILGRCMNSFKIFVVCNIYIIWAMLAIILQNAMKSWLFMRCLLGCSNYGFLRLWWVVSGCFQWSLFISFMHAALELHDFWASCMNLQRFELNPCNEIPYVWWKVSIYVMLVHEYLNYGGYQACHKIYENSTEVIRHCETLFMILWYSLLRKENAYFKGLWI